MEGLGEGTRYSGLIRTPVLYPFYSYLSCNIMALGTRETFLNAVAMIFLDTMPAAPAEEKVDKSEVIKCKAFVC